MNLIPIILVPPACLTILLGASTSTSSRASMPHDMPPTPDVPIACSLSLDDLKNRHNPLFPGVIMDAAEVADLENGLRMRFENRVGLLARIVGIADWERTCCSFLRFQLTAERGDGPIPFELISPPGTREVRRSV